MKTVLLLAYECAPYNRPGSTIGAQRPFQFAKYLPKNGWRTIVICCDFSQRYTLNPKEDWKSLIAERVVYELNEWDQDKSLMIALPSLQYANFNDRIWLSTVEIEKNKGTYIAKPEVWNFFKRKLTSFIKLFQGDHSQSWQKVALFASEILFKQLRIDFVIACHSPDASLHVAAELHAQYGCRWAVDFRDPVLQPFSLTLRPILKRYFSGIIRSSSFLINVNPAWVEFDAQDFNKKSVMITNGFDEEEIPQINVERVQTLKIGVYGNVSFPGNIDILFDALKKFMYDMGNNDWKMSYFGNLADEFRHKASALMLSDNVVCSNHCSREVVLQEMANNDILILFSLAQSKVSDPYLAKGYYPGKVFEMLGLQKPILVIPGDQGVLDALIRESGTGVILRNEIEIVDALKGYYDQKFSSEQVNFIPNKKFIKKYSRQEQSKSLAVALNNHY